MLSILLLLPALVVLIYLYITRNFNYWQSRGIPFEKPVPFLGNTPLVLIRRAFGEYLKDLYEKSSGPLYGFFIYDKPQLLVRDPEIIKNILVKDFQHFFNRTVTMNKAADPIGSQMLFVIHNPEWKTLRQKMTSAFSSAKLKLMFPLMAEASKDFVRYVENLKGRPVNTKILALKNSTDVISSCAFGVKGACFESENSEFFNAANKIFGFTWIRGIQMNCYFTAHIFVKLFRMKFVHPDSSKFLKGVFMEVMNMKRKTNIKRNDLIDALLEIKAADSELTFAINDELAVSQAIQFIVAGYETSGSTTCFALYELAMQLDVQDRLRAEIVDVIKKNDGLTYDGIKEMKFLDMVLSETLRKYPVMPFIDRRAQVDYKIPGMDFTIEKGTAVYMPSLALHFDAQYFPDPEKFEPERFSTENKKDIQFCSYMPFGEGPRNCIGARFGILSSKLSIISMITNFEVTRAAETPLTVEYDPRGFLLSPAKPIMLSFKKIEAQL